VIYAPGELKAIANKGGNKIGEALVRTASKPTAIRLSPDRTKLAATGEDLSYVLVEALDNADNPCPLADNLIHFTVEGPAEIAGVGNGNPLSIEPFQADQRHLFYGKAMVIIRALEKKNGDIHSTARAEGLKQASAFLHASHRK
jgi:beta-galactosidase